jgi:hypothetical protein
MQQPRPLPDVFGPRLAATLTDPQAADLAEVFGLIADAEGPHIARAWCIGRNPHLDDVTPIAAIQDGRTSDVLAAVHAYLA